jgi:hypothetical protein
VTIDFAVPESDDELINALRGACSDPIHHRSQKAILDLLEFMTPENAERVCGVFVNCDKKGVALDFAWPAFWTRWGEIDPLGAFRFALSQKDLVQRSGHPDLQNIIRGWSTVDSMSAERWLREHPDSPHYGSMVSALAADRAATNSSDATAFVLSLPLDPDSLQRSLGSIAETLGKMSEPERLEAWFDGLPEPARQLAFNQTASRITEGNVEDAKQWFTAQADKPWRDDNNYLEFIHRFGTEDPAGAAAWVFSLPPRAGEFYPIGTSKVMEQWTLKDASSAFSWLMQHGQESWWPRAAKGYFNGLESRDRAAAVAFMDSLGQAQREAVLQDLQISK